MFAFDAPFRVPSPTMASNSTVHTLPNPNTPLAFLPPILAEEFEVSSYVVIAGLSASTP
jgi:hypothetical protein